MSGEEIEALAMTFEIMSCVNANGSPLVGDGGALEQVPLIPNGSNIAVTKSNVIKFIHSIAHHKLNVESNRQIRYFLRGFHSIIPPAWVRLFSGSELQKVVGGDDSVKGFDVAQLKRTMVYGGGYHPTQPFIISFWEVLAEMSAEDQRLFLKFQTSCSRQPLLGFASLTPLPCIHKGSISVEQERRGEFCFVCLSSLFPSL
jgi:ubiquitin-protein ligase E3 C